MIYENAGCEMSLLVKETDMLPEYTPIFLSDIGGRIVASKNLKAEKDDFLSVARIISGHEREKYLRQREESDLFVMHTRSNPKDLLVLAKTQSGFLHGVVCSYSEKNCIRLDDYYQKLLSYRDYLDSLARLSVMPDVHMPAIRLFEVRIGGVSQLLEMSGARFGADEYVDLPLCMVLDKVARFVKSVSENSALRISLDCDEDRSVNVPVCILGLIVSCVTLAVRCSRDAHIRIGTQNKDKGYSYLIIETSLSASLEQSEMFEDAVTGAFLNIGAGFGITKSDGLYSIQIKLSSQELKKEVLAEEDELSRLISQIFAERDISDLVYTILP